MAGATTGGLAAGGCTPVGPLVPCATAAAGDIAKVRADAARMDRRRGPTACVEREDWSKRIIALLSAAGIADLLVFRPRRIVPGIPAKLLAFGRPGKPVLMCAFND